MRKSTNSAGTFGILGVGVYLPRLRLERAAVAAGHRWMAPALKGLARGTRTMANWDEDAITMAVEAGRAALAHRKPERVGMLTLASTTLPFAERLNAAVVGSALALPDDCSALDTGGSLRAGSSALLRALDAATDRTELVIGAERRVPKPASAGELLAGDGAAAVLVGPGEPIAVLRGAATATADFVDHFRETGRASDYGWEERWIREEGYSKIVPPVIARALEAADCGIEDIDHFVMPAALPRANDMIAKKLGIRPAAVVDTLFEVCGDTGCAHPLLMLAHALNGARPGQKLLVVQFGSGCDALVLETTEHHAPDTGSHWLDGRNESNYLKYLSTPSKRTASPTSRRASARTPATGCRTDRARRSSSAMSSSTARRAS